MRSRTCEPSARSVPQLDEELRHRKRPGVRPARSKMRPQPRSKGAQMGFYPSGAAEALIVVYDLRIPSAWKRAHRDRKWWGKERCDFEFLDRNHVILTFRPGGALGLEASA